MLDPKGAGVSEEVWSDSIASCVALPVAEVIRETHDSCSLVFDVPADLERRFRYKSGQFLSFKVQGIIGNISEGGCQAMFPVPIQVGDIYRMHFDKKDLDLPLTFVRCQRCRLISDDAFEAGFVFFSPIPLPANLVG